MHDALKAGEPGIHLMCTFVEPTDLTLQRAHVGVLFVYLSLLCIDQRRVRPGTKASISHNYLLNVRLRHVSHCIFSHGYPLTYVKWTI